MNNLEWYISQFPESQFPCVKEYKKKYVENVCVGRANAAKRNVLFCGITRNSAEILPHTLARIQTLASYFADYHVFLYENDSTDGTKKILQRYSTLPFFSIISENVNPPPFTNPKGLPRRIHMAKARNKYLDFAREYIRHHHIDYIIIFDTDLLGGWSYHGILNSLGHMFWDVIGSNSLYYQKREDNKSVRLFYDSWAFRYDGQPEEKEDKEINLLRFNRGEPMVKVNSCFGGLAIYKPTFLLEGLNYTELDCDHPSLNNQLCKLGYRIFLNPSQITLYNRNEYSI